MASGKTLRLNKLAMSQIQTLVSEELRMERGEYKENSNVVRLEAVEYKAQQEEKRVKRLQEQNQVLEQKKNEVRARIARLEKERGAITSNETQGGTESADRKSTRLNSSHV